MDCVKVSAIYKEDDLLGYDLVITKKEQLALMREKASVFFSKKNFPDMLFWKGKGIRLLKLLINVELNLRRL